MIPILILILELPKNNMIPILIPIPASCDSDSNYDSSDIDFGSNSDSSGIKCDLNSESRVSYHAFQFRHKHLWCLFVSQYMQQAVFHNGNQFTIYGWNF